MSFSEFRSFGLLSGITFPESIPAWLVITLAYLIPSVIAYLLGSLNFAVIVSSSLYHDDVRNHGSGNAGLTNMLRVYGKKAALFTLLGDVGKAIVSVLVGTCFFGRQTAYVAGLFCMIGHIFPLYYQFRGGKGVLTAATVILCLDPLVGIILLLIFVLIVWGTRYVSLGSVIGGLIYPVLLNRITAIFSVSTGDGTVRMGNDLLVTVCSFLIAALIVFMHRANIKRLLEGNENKLSFGKKHTVNEKKPDDSSNRKEG